VTFQRIFRFGALDREGRYQIHVRELRTAFARDDSRAVISSSS
jgi:hypothetical protein